MQYKPAFGHSRAFGLHVYLYYWMRVAITSYLPMCGIFPDLSPDRSAQLVQISNSRAKFQISEDEAFSVEVSLFYKLFLVIGTIYQVDGLYL